jgi:hypothetical protein
MLLPDGRCDRGNLSGVGGPQRQKRCGAAAPRESWMTSERLYDATAPQDRVGDAWLGSRRRVRETGVEPVEYLNPEIVSKSVNQNEQQIIRKTWCASRAHSGCICWRPYSASGSGASGRLTSQEGPAVRISLPPPYPRFSRYPPISIARPQTCF